MRQPPKPPRKPSTKPPSQRISGRAGASTDSPEADLEALPPEIEPGASDDSLDLLVGLGFGPDTVLMNDPKLFVDGRFLASLLVELQDELGAERSSLALFQIGLLHGLRDAARMCREIDGPGTVEDGADDRQRNSQDRYRNAMHTAPTPAETTSLVMQWTAGAQTDEDGAFSLEGCWPERHEAVSHCSRLGSADRPACYLSAGYTTGWLSGTFNRPLISRETECAARGDEACRFEVYEASVWRSADAPDIHRLLAEVPFEAFRKVALSPPIERQDIPPSTADSGAPTDGGQFDRSQPVVHIWGPVMVLPFTTLDEALGTVDMLGRDLGIGEIRAVVVDLRERPLDEGFGAAALEQILETIESWNAQSLITGVSPGSEAAITGLEASHLVLRKDLTEAIATAFQIADAQKHFL